MPFVPVPDVCAVHVRYTAQLQQCENILYFAADGGWDSSQLVDIAGEVGAWWQTELRPLVSNTVQLREVYAEDLSSANGPTGASAPPAATFGQNSSPAMPANVSLAISFRTALRGRSFRGRNYVVGLTESQVADSTVVASVVSSLQAAYTSLLPSGGYFTRGLWSVVSRYSNGAPRAVGVSTFVTSVVVVDAVVDSQRRRLPGRGR